MKVAIVAPHIFMQDALLRKVIFSPGTLAIDLANELISQGVDVTLCTLGAVTTTAKNLTADLSLFEQELQLRGDDYMDLLRKHPLTFITLARQVQGEILAKVFTKANDGEFDIVHVYMNEEELGLTFAALCNKPVVFTHHDPFNFLTRYRSIMPKHTDKNWLSISLAQRNDMPPITNWIENIYHGLQPDAFKPVQSPTNDYIAYIGRIIEPKGVHLAIDAVKLYNQQNNANLKLKIAGKHYSGDKDGYWQRILPEIDGGVIQYVDFIDNDQDKNVFLANAKALIVPSIFSEPFGMVSIEALACGTPVIGLDSGAIPEVITNGKTGIVAPKVMADKTLNQSATVAKLAEAIGQINTINRVECRKDFEARFTISHMAENHITAYKKLVSKSSTK